MNYLKSQSSNPYFNAALEEYLLKMKTEEFFVLYVNDPSIIVGKHQNTLAEINYKYVKNNNIPVVRRISGGGTVFHDLGNLNYMFITNGEPGKLIDFKLYTSYIIETLNELGINAKYEGKNDIRVNNLKISGNAGHVHNNRVLHHGTLLVSSDLTNLYKALHENIEEYEDNAVKSIKSKVVNIAELTSTPINILQLETLIARNIDKHYILNPFQLSNKDIEAITELVDKKYFTWDWNFAYSSSYSFYRHLNIRDELIKVNVIVEKGFVKNIKVAENSNVNITKMLETILGIKHCENDIYKKISEQNIANLSNIEMTYVAETIM